MPTTGQIIEKLLSQNMERLADTVDTIKTGAADKPVRRIAVTFLADVDVIRRAVAAGCDFIITHEPTFYGHHDNTEQLDDDPVYQYKRKLLDDNGVTVFRYHDHIHMHCPDLITAGILDALGWMDYADTEEEDDGEQFTGIVSLPDATAGEVAAHVREKLGGVSHFIGDTNAKVGTVGLMLGSPGFGHHHYALRKYNPDLIICGEVNEWETPVYVKDSIAAGLGGALLVVGHCASEQAGMAYFAKKLQAMLPDVPVEFIPSAATYQLL